MSAGLIGGREGTYSSFVSLGKGRRSCCLRRGTKITNFKIKLLDGGGGREVGGARFFNWGGEKGGRIVPCRRVSKKEILQLIKRKKNQRKHLGRCGRGGFPGHPTFFLGKGGGGVRGNKPFEQREKGVGEFLLGRRWRVVFT